MGSTDCELLPPLLLGSLDVSVLAAAEGVPTVWGGFRYRLGGRYDEMVGGNGCSITKQITYNGMGAALAAIMPNERRVTPYLGPHELRVTSHPASLWGLAREFYLHPTPGLARLYTATWAAAVLSLMIDSSNMQRLSLNPTTMLDASALPSVLVWNPDGEPRASALATHLNLSEVADRGDDPELLYLFFQNQQLVVGRNLRQREKPFAIDFVKQFRDRHRGRELLLKAIGGRRPHLRVLDATAGLGRDSFLLARYGATVTLCERNPIVVAMLADGINRAQGDPEVGDIVARMNLHPVAAQSVLAAIADAQRPHVVYLDPMFPESGKSALVKKEMRLFHSLVGMDDDADALLDLALDAAKHRVVVKRPPHAPPLGGRAPQFAVAGKAVRFDIYPLKAFNKP